MAFFLEEINHMTKTDPAGFIRLCDERYESQLHSAAQVIAERMSSSRIVLLSGPTGSGKTTTAMKLTQHLKQLGVGSIAVSLDDYYNDVGPSTPLDENGEYDFESPLCLDLDLLNEHLNLLNQGEIVEIPHFDFPSQRRSREISTQVRLGENEIIIFEGIHALGPYIAGRYKAGTGIFVSIENDIIDESGQPRFYATRMRLARRMVRDYLTRGASPEFTLTLWDNVRKSEKAYILPYGENAHVRIDSTIPYEIGVMKTVVMPMLRSVPESANRYEQVCSMIERYEAFEAIGSQLVPADSLLREFIGNEK